MDDYSCAACPEGKYKTIDTDQVPDPHPCFSCLTTGEWSTEGATQCACARGYSGVAGGKEYGTCELCTSGKFKNETKDGACELCSQRAKCDIGFFSTDCVPAQDYSCLPCTNVLAEHTEYISAAPIGSSNCTVRLGCSTGSAATPASCARGPAAARRRAVQLALPDSAASPSTTDSCSFVSMGDDAGGWVDFERDFVAAEQADVVRPLTNDVRRRLLT